MNEAHLQVLASDEWATHLEQELLPWVLSVADVGDDVIEVGPGPGRTTDLLRTRAARVTAVELDPDLAAALATRLAGTNVEVLERDAADTGLDTGRFSLAACFSVLHHVPTAEHQDRVFAELCRVLRTGGQLVAVDGRDVPELRGFHDDDTFVPLDPDTLEARLVAAGFTDVAIELEPMQVRFQARKP
jgi:SAM-dependent methyltransferase